MHYAENAIGFRILQLNSWKLINKSDLLNNSNDLTDLKIHLDLRGDRELDNTFPFLTYTIHGGILHAVGAVSESTKSCFRSSSVIT